jgi:putative spermidine/putrescine transport system permease protein
MSSETNKILTTDGIPLEVSLKKAERKNKIKAFLLVAPLLLFLLITYIFPIGRHAYMRSVDDKMVTEMLPKTYKAMEKWDGKELPSEEVFEAFYLDFRQLVDEKREGKLSTQLNYTKNGFKSIIKKLRRKSKSFEEGNYKEQIMAVHKRWADVEYWQAIKERAPAYTAQKYLKGMDMYKNASGEIVSVSMKIEEFTEYLWLKNFRNCIFCYTILFFNGISNSSFVSYFTHEV